MNQGFLIRRKFLQANVDEDVVEVRQNVAFRIFFFKWNQFVSPIDLLQIFDKLGHLIRVVQNVFHSKLALQKLLADFENNYFDQV